MTAASGRTGGGARGPERAGSRPGGDDAARGSERPHHARHVYSARLEEFERLRKRLTWALAAMLVLTLIGVVGYAVIGGGHTSLIDSVYMTVITLTTVGYGEVVDLQGSPGGRVFTIGLILFGIGIFTYTVPMLAAFLIEGHFLHIFARRRMEKTINRMNGHHVVCGDAGAAWFVTRELLGTDRDVVMVVPTEVALGTARARLKDIPCVLGDPSEDEVLLEAGIDRAAGVVACMESDKDNILVVFTARRLAPGARIIAALTDPSHEGKLRQAGADGVVSPDRIGGLRMASELVRPAVVSFLDTMLRDKARGLRVEEVVVREGSSWIGRPVKSLKIHENAGAVLLAVRRAGEEPFQFDPDPELVLDAGMALVVMVDADGRRRLEAQIRG